MCTTSNRPFVSVSVVRSGFVFRRKLYRMPLAVAMVISVRWSSSKIKNTFPKQLRPRNCCFFTGVSTLLWAALQFLLHARSWFLAAALSQDSGSSSALSDSPKLSDLFEGEGKSPKSPQLQPGKHRAQPAVLRQFSASRMALAKVAGQWLGRPCLVPPLGTQYEETRGVCPFVSLPVCVTGWLSSLSRVPACRCRIRLVRDASTQMSQEDQADFQVGCNSSWAPLQARECGMNIVYL